MARYRGLDDPALAFLAMAAAVGAAIGGYLLAILNASLAYLLPALLTIAVATGFLYGAIRYCTNRLPATGGLGRWFRLALFGQVVAVPAMIYCWYWAADVSYLVASEPPGAIVEVSLEVEATGGERAAYVVGEGVTPFLYRDNRTPVEALASLRVRRGGRQWLVFRMALDGYEPHVERRSKSLAGIASRVAVYGSLQAR